MSSLSLDDNQASFQIRGFKPGEILINERIITQNLIVSPHQLIEHWAPQRADDIIYETLLPAMALKPLILLIGTGERQRFIALEHYGALINQGIGVELMSTAAACRTYNALSAEGREVVAALILM